MVIPWMRRMVANYHGKSKSEKKNAMDKQEKERQQLLSMKRKSAVGDQQIYGRRCCDPACGDRKNSKMTKRQPPGTITTDPKDVGEIIR